MCTIDCRQLLLGLCLQEFDKVLVTARAAGAACGTGKDDSEEAAKVRLVLDVAIPGVLMLGTWGLQENRTSCSSGLMSQQTTRVYASTLNRRMHT